MERVFNKIVIVSLCDLLTKEVASALSQTLGMMFCDTKDLVEYELIDKNAIENLCSKEYLKERERKVLQHISSFENVVVSINFDYLTHNLNIIKKNSALVFLKLTKSYVVQNATSVEALSYENRTKKLEEISSLTVNLRKTDTKFACEKIIDAIRGIL